MLLRQRQVHVRSDDYRASRENTMEYRRRTIMETLKNPRQLRTEPGTGHSLTRGQNQYNQSMGVFMRDHLSTGLLVEIYL